MRSFFFFVSSNTLTSPVLGQNLLSVVPSEGVSPLCNLYLYLLHQLYVNLPYLVTGLLFVVRTFSDRPNPFVLRLLDLTNSSSCPFPFPFPRPSLSLDYEDGRGETFRGSRVQE